MAARDDRYTDIDQNIAANLRTYREAGNISQDELAQRMADRGFGFSQATIWKIESGQRPVRASELVALADSLGVMTATTIELPTEKGLLANVSVAVVPYEAPEATASEPPLTAPKGEVPGARLEPVVL